LLSFVCYNNTADNRQQHNSSGNLNQSGERTLPVSLCINSFQIALPATAAVLAATATIMNQTQSRGRGLHTVSDAVAATDAQRAILIEHSHRTHANQLQVITLTQLLL
jgi:hypothetical protein